MHISDFSLNVLLIEIRKIPELSFIAYYCYVIPKCVTYFRFLNLKRILPRVHNITLLCSKINDTTANVEKYF